MAGLDWLTARPVAHRGLHDAAAGIVENTPSAVQAAIAAGYGIEVDLQVSADGEAMVHHDATLGRLTVGEGRLSAMSAAALKRIAFKATRDRMIALGELLDLVAGRAALVLELKSAFDGDPRLPQRVAQALAGYRGPVAAMSFDPAQVNGLRRLAPALPRGIVAQRRHGGAGSSPSARRRLTHALDCVRAWPHFLAYRVQDLPAIAPLLARYLFARPVLAWTVRSDADRERARRWADQIIFEGFRP